MGNMEHWAKVNAILAIIGEREALFGEIRYVRTVDPLTAAAWIVSDRDMNRGIEEEREADGRS